MELKDKLKQINLPILVTGAAGFIGRHLLECLADMEIPAVGFDLESAGIPGPLKDKVADGKLQWLYGDITREEDVIAAITKVGTVIHLAAMVGDWGAEEQHKKVTVEGSRIMFREAAKRHLRVVLASSIVVYGDKLSSQVCDESTPYGLAMGPYSRAKQAQETIAKEYCRRDNLRLTIVRPANVYGPGSKPWVHAVIEELRRGTPALIGGGQFSAGLVYVSNLVDILLLAVLRGAGKGEIYNACDDGLTTWREYFSDLAELANLKPPRSLPRLVAEIAARLLETIWRGLPIKSRPPLTREALNLVGSDIRIDMSKTRKAMDYSPRIEYNDALLKIKEYWSAHQATE